MLYDSNGFFRVNKMTTSRFVALLSLRCCTALCTTFNSHLKFGDIGPLLLDNSIVFSVWYIVIGSTSANTKVV